MAEPRDVAVVLRRAADVIRVRGWHQGAYQGKDGCVCALGALNLAAGRLAHSDWFLYPDAGDAAEALRRHLRVNGLITDQSIDEWNDESCRTVDEVLDALEGAAKDVEAGNG